LKSEGFYVLATKKKNLTLHIYQKIIKRKDEYMISGIEGKGGVFLLFLVAPPFLSLFFFI
jgi:hypothetical protein